MISGDKCMIIVDPKLLDDQDIPGLEKLLKNRVKLAPADVSIYIQIAEKQLKKKAKMAWATGYTIFKDWQVDRYNLSELVLDGPKNEALQFLSESHSVVIHTITKYMS